MKNFIKYFIVLLALSYNLQAQTEVDYYNSGYQKSLSDNYDGAIKDFNTALNINSNYTKALIGRAFCFQKLMNKEKDKNTKLIYYALCIKDLDYLISQTEDKRYITLRGNTHYSWYLYSKNYKYRTLACNDWKKALALGDVNAEEFLANYCEL